MILESTAFTKIVCLHFRQQTMKNEYIGTPSTLLCPGIRMWVFTRWSSMSHWQFLQIGHSTLPELCCFNQAAHFLRSWALRSPFLSGMRPPRMFGYGIDKQRVPVMWRAGSRRSIKRFSWARTEYFQWHGGSQRGHGNQPRIDPDE